MEVGGVSLAREEAGAAAEAQCEGTVCGAKRQGSSTRHAVTQSHVDDEVQPHELVDAAIASDVCFKSASFCSNNLKYPPWNWFPRLNMLYTLP